MELVGFCKEKPFLVDYLFPLFGKFDVHADSMSVPAK